MCILLSITSIASSIHTTNGAKKKKKGFKLTPLDSNIKVNAELIIMCKSEIKFPYPSDVM